MLHEKAPLRARIRAQRRDRRARWDALPAREADELRRREQRGLVRSWLQACNALGVGCPHLPALFVPTTTEPDVSAIVAESGRCCLPVVVNAQGRALDEPAWGCIDFPDASTSAWSSLTTDRLAAVLDQPSARWPAQPHLSDAPYAELPDSVDIVLLAGLAADLSGTRLGQGGGWYDRALSKWNTHHAERSPQESALPVRRRAPLVIALFDEEVWDAGTLPVDPHDVAVDAIVTPTRMVMLTR